MSLEYVIKTHITVILFKNNRQIVNCLLYTDTSYTLILDCKLRFKLNEIGNHTITNVCR